MMLGEKLNIFGILGCILCIVGSLTIVLHAPEERPIASVQQVWTLAMKPGRLSSLPDMTMCFCLWMMLRLLIPLAVCRIPILRNVCGCRFTDAHILDISRVWDDQYLCVYWHMFHCGFVIGG
jgi:Magnesium transporter NIPA